MRPIRFCILPVLWALARSLVYGGSLLAFPFDLSRKAEDRVAERKSLKRSPNLAVGLHGERAKNKKIVVEQTKCQAIHHKITSRERMLRRSADRVCRALSCLGLVAWFLTTRIRASVDFSGRPTDCQRERSMRRDGSPFAVGG